MPGPQNSGRANRTPGADTPPHADPFRTTTSDNRLQLDDLGVWITLWGIQTAGEPLPPLTGLAEWFPADPGTIIDAAVARLRGLGLIVGPDDSYRVLAST